MEKELEGKGFLHIHRSYIVNMLRVAAFTTYNVEIGKLELPIGESYKNYVFKALHKG